MHRSHHWLLAVIVLLLLDSSAPAADVDFSRDVLPLLSENCFHCHGPDANKRQAGLRLDTKEGAFRTKKEITSIVPGKSSASEVIRRITSNEPDEQMPPPDSNRKLTAKQKETLRAWVDQGAKWGQHWAFNPLPRDVAVPTVATAVNPIDQFIQNRLLKDGVKPAPEAPKETWLRRVTFDLTGLPPTLAELDAFTKDTSPRDCETVVDRLLASPRYGERMAADWLDIARYSDTHGYQSDRFRAMWPYRDWVIAAFNRNQPFDQFLTDQLAGDLVPNATKDQRLATAFNRLHMQNEEGGVVAEEFRVAYVVDRVNTMGTAFLGMTFECTRCHDHKYDPLTQKDFYSLFAFFQNIDEAGQTSYFTTAMPVPALLLSTDEQDKKIAVMLATIREKEAAVTTACQQAETAFRWWLKLKPKAVPNLTGLTGSYSFDEWKDNKVANAVDAKAPATAHENPKPVPGKVGQGAELNGENGFDFPGVGHFTRSDPFTISLWLNPAKPVPYLMVLHHSKAPVDAGHRGYDLTLEDGKPALGLYHMWPGNSLKVRAKEPLPVGSWSHFTMTYDGSSRADGVKLYLDGQLLPTEIVRDSLTKDITYGGAEPNLTIGHRFRDAGFKGGKVDELRVFNRSLTPLEVTHLAQRDDFTTAWNTASPQLRDYFVNAVYGPTRQATDALHAARRDHNLFTNPITEAMVMREMPTPKPSYILKRGAYDALGDTVTANTPAVLPKFPADLPRNRYGLAKWLTTPDHPLTARVTVNRLWQQMFGTGLVETSDNFGTTGTPPTHPELLDWLAREFVTKAWDVKHLLKQMALSATYRQSSRTSAEWLQRDPYNQLLAHAPVRRLTAEMIRDQALVVSGLLVEKRGGPSVYPYQPEGLWNDAMGRPHYPRSTGADLYRRSLYTIGKRTAPHPQMTTFDGSERSVCTVRRQSTSTPLQALALLNDPQIVEAARFLAARMMQEGGPTNDDRITWLMRTVTGRSVNEKELAIFGKLFEEQKTAFENDPQAAEKLLAVGDTKPDPKLNKLDLAAATTLALAVLNHDGAVNRR